jgi:hypothetical protein
MEGKRGGGSEEARGEDLYPSDLHVYSDRESIWSTTQQGESGVDAGGVKDGTVRGNGDGGGNFAVAVVGVAGGGIHEEDGRRQHVGGTKRQRCG